MLPGLGLGCGGTRGKAPQHRWHLVGVGCGECTAAPWGHLVLGGQHGGVGAAGLGVVAFWLQPHDPGVQTWGKAPWEPRAAAAFVLLLLLLPLPPPLLPAAAGLAGRRRRGARWAPPCAGLEQQGGLHVRGHSWAVLESAAFPVALWSPKGCSGLPWHGAGSVLRATTA